MDERPPSPRDLLYALFRQQRAFALILTVAVVVPIVYWAFTFPVYRAEVRLLVKLGKETLSAITSYNNNAYNVLFQPRPQNINNELEILRKGRFSDEFLPRMRATIDSCYAARQLGPLGKLRFATAQTWKHVHNTVLAPLYATGLMHRPTHDEILLDRASRALHAEILEETDIIQVRFDWDDPQIAALVLNQIIDEYLKLHLRVHESDRSHNFYETQAQIYEDSLQLEEKALKEFTTTRSIANIELQKDILLRDISDLERRHTDVMSAYVEALSKAQKVRDMHRRAVGWVETPKMGSGDYSALRTLDDEYFSLKTAREEYKPNSKEAQRIDREIARLRDQKSESVLNILDGEITAKAKDRASLEKTLAAKKVEFDKLNQETLRLAGHEREREVLQNTYLLYRNKAEELRVSDAMDADQITSVKVVARAEPPERPAYPRMGVVLPVAVFAGLFLGLLYALLAQALDRSFKGEDEVVEYLGAPLLMTIPSLKRTGFRHHGPEAVTYPKAGDVDEEPGLAPYPDSERTSRSLS